MPLDLVVPGSLATRTGGYGYDRRIVAELGARGHAVTVHELAGEWPRPDAAARRAAAERFAEIPAGRCVVVDGLAFGALPELAREAAKRLALVALVHHPLADESGLDEAEAARLRDTERRALTAARRVVTTSAATARALVAHYDVPPERIATVEPGTDAAPEARGSADGIPNLLCVATLTARKGHATLFDALARLADRSWRLRCIGSATRDPATARALGERLARLGIADRVALDGEVDDAALDRAFSAADLFVLASRHEGYGMVFAESLARALPVVASGSGAVAETVPADAGIVVAVGDVDALTDAIGSWLDEPALRARLASGARRARGTLRSWERAGAEFAAVLERSAAASGNRDRPDAR